MGIWINVRTEFGSLGGFWFLFGGLNLYFFLMLWKSTDYNLKGIIIKMYLQKVTNFQRPNLYLFTLLYFGCFYILITLTILQCYHLNIHRSITKSKATFLMWKESFILGLTRIHNFIQKYTSTNSFVCCQITNNSNNFVCQNNHPLLAISQSL